MWGADTKRAEISNLPAKAGAKITMKYPKKKKIYWQKRGTCPPADQPYARQYSNSGFQ